MKNYNVFIVVSVLFLSACQHRGNESVAHLQKDTLLIDSINVNYYFDYINNLKSIKDTFAKIEHAPQYIINKLKNNKLYNYQVQVGYDNGVRFVIISNYYINTIDSSIKYLDTQIDSLVNPK